MDSGAYYFIAMDGRRGDIIRCQTYQPEITNPDDYNFFMWVDSMQGFFLLRQQFLESQPQQWELIGEIEEVEQSHTQFEELSDWMRGLLDSGEVK